MRRALVEKAYRLANDRWRQGVLAARSGGPPRPDAEGAGWVVRVTNLTYREGYEHGLELGADSFVVTPPVWAQVLAEIQRPDGT